MKHVLFLIFALSLMTSVCTAQDRIYVGGEVGLSYLDDTDVSSIKIAPTIGYKLNNKWDIGAYIGYTYMQENGGDKTSYSVSIAPYARYYFMEKGLFQLFLDMGAGYSYSDMAFANIQRDNRNGFEVGFKPGFAIKLHDKIRLTTKIAFVGYRKDYLTYDNGYFGTISLNNLDFGLIINL